MKKNVLKNTKPNETAAQKRVRLTLARHPASCRAVSSSLSSPDVQTNAAQPLAA